MATSNKTIPVATIQNLMLSYEPDCRGGQHHKLKSFMKELSSVICANESSNEQVIKNNLDTNNDEDSQPQPLSVVAVEPSVGGIRIANDQVPTKHDHVTEGSFRSSKILEALSNTVILTEILGELSLHDLLENRRVNSHWNEISSFVIRKRNLWTLNLTKVLKTTDPEKGSQNHDILACLGPSSGFPCTSLTLDLSLLKNHRELSWHLLHANEKENEEISRKELNEYPSRSRILPLPVDSQDLRLFAFLKLYGHQIKVLKMKCIGFGREDTISHLILRHFPNLQSLSIYGRARKHVWPNHRSFEIKSNINNNSPVQPMLQLQLPSLRTLEYNEPPPLPLRRKGTSPSISPLLEVILKGSRYLREIKSVTVQTTGAILTAGKIRLVREVFINLWSMSLYGMYQVPSAPNHFLHLLVQFADAGPKLESLFVLHPDYDQSKGVVKGAIGKILESSQKTLKTLKIPPCYLSGPASKSTRVFPNLKCLSVEHYCARKTDREYCGGILSPFFEGSHNNFPFPNVVYLRLNISYRDLVNLCQNLELNRGKDGGNLTPFPSVTTLELTLCQELTELSYSESRSIRKYFHALLPAVRTVYFQDKVGETFPRERYYNLIYTKAIDCLPPTVETVQVPHMGLTWTKKEIEYQIYWIYSAHHHHHHHVVKGSDFFKYLNSVPKL